MAGVQSPADEMNENFSRQRLLYHHHRHPHHLGLKLVEIFKTEACLSPLRFCQPTVWNHHYLTTSGSGNDNYDYDAHDDDYDYYDDEYYDDNDNGHLPAATPSGASSKTRQFSGF